ncbi:hybrid sensor histidine kinase/response regulator transcription factor [Marinilabilia salmonicolor]|uniref:histidine kinase n=1 Tax=Marinilabilia salmonicolor TaxID=989 RepID=A0A368VJZ1_9BACT|nr:hybrid sensor histidine kinase/response regulator transcription factor [Marinilabilia salmonicolor]RCW39301.1 signal transduction histidine kinase [Marinilabilia salmonicolor]
MSLRVPTYSLLTSVLLLTIFVATTGATSPLYFSNLTIEQGLPSNVTNSIVQDKHGFIWIGTQEGVCRYDGFKMLTFQHTGGPGSIPSNNISALICDDDRIWVGTWDGLCTINIHTFQIETINIGKNKTIRTLFRDKQGNIWIGTANGLLKHNPNNNIFNWFDSSNSGLSHNTIRSFHEADNGDLWIGTYDGLNRFRDGEITTFDVKGAYKPLLENNLIVSISEYSGNCDSLLWVGTETGLALFNTKTGDFKLYNSTNTNFSNEVIKTIYHASDSVLWLGTDFGLHVFDVQEESVTAYFHDPLINNTIANNVVWQILEDNKERVWLITSGGVSIANKSEPYYHLHEEFFSNKEPRIGNQIRDILTDRKGNVWLATIHGVVKKNEETERRTTYSSTSQTENKVLLDNVYALEEDKKQRIWIGTAGGINILDPKSQRMSAITAGKENGLTSNYISSIVQAPDGSFWVSAWEGGVFRTEAKGESPQNYQFTRIDSNGDGHLIRGNRSIYYAIGNQLWTLDAKKGKQPVSTVNGIIANGVITILRAGKNNSLWIGAENRLIQYQETSEEIREYHINVSHPQKIINLEEDNDGNLWGTTQNSIFRLDISRDKVITIPVEEGSPFKGFDSNCSAQKQNGNILFGGDNAYLEITPSHISYPESKPTMFISGLRVNNQAVTPSQKPDILKDDIAFSNQIDLKHHQNSLTFEFSALDYLYPDNGQFRYRLRPEQDQWLQSSGQKNYAVYANIKPGNYTLEVQGTNHLGVWSETKNLQIHIAPSIWLSKGFLTLYIVLIIGITYFIFRIYSYRQRLNNELKIVKIEKQHSEALYQAKIRFFTNISHEFRTPLGLIISPLKQLSKGDIKDPRFRRMIELAHRNAGRLYKLINQLLDFRKIESSQLQLIQQPVEINAFVREVYASFDDLAQRHQIDYQLQPLPEPHQYLLDADKVETILFNLLSNAFKYSSDEGTINVTLNITSSLNNAPTLEVSIRDFGSGIAEQDREHIFELFYRTDQKINSHEGSGIGLTLAMEYAQLHGGTIQLKSQPGEGSEFTLVLPAIETTEQHDIAKTENTLIPKSQDSSNASTLSPNAKRILIVDDNTDFLDYLKINMEEEYALTLAENGAQALRKATTDHPDLIISDVMMPVMDGMELCGSLKTNQATAHIPVILLTAKTLDMDKTEGMNRGADMYITKPFDIDFLKSSIHSLFRREEQMARYIRNQLLLTPEKEEPGEQPEEIFLKKVMSIIRHNLSNPDFSVEMLSSAVGMSATHLYRRLKSITGLSTRDIINNFRMQKAEQMLSNREGNITEVMYAVGFSSLSSFSKSFKAKFGVSPKGYMEK